LPALNQTLGNFNRRFVLVNILHGSGAEFWYKLEPHVEILFAHFAQNFALREARLPFRAKSSTPPTRTTSQPYTYFHLCYALMWSGLDTSKERQIVADKTGRSRAVLK
jgi:hypothetical protein